MSEDEGALEWTIPVVSNEEGTGTGSLEFEVEGDDVDAFFPVQVTFVAQDTICGVKVRSFGSLDCFVGWY